MLCADPSWTIGNDPTRDPLEVKCRNLLPSSYRQGQWDLLFGTTLFYGTHRCHSITKGCSPRARKEELSSFAPTLPTPQVILGPVYSHCKHIFLMCLLQHVPTTGVSLRMSKTHQTVPLQLYTLAEW